MKLLKYLIIRVTCKNADTALKVYTTLYSNVTPIVSQPQVVKQSINVPNSPLKPMDKKQEMIESLEFLKAKSVKSKQDKESISMLEAVLKNMM
jgi:hypothetical protein